MRQTKHKTLAKKRKRTFTQINCNEIFTLFSHIISKRLNPVQFQIEQKGHENIKDEKEKKQSVTK